MSTSLQECPKRPQVKNLTFWASKAFSAIFTHSIHS